MSGFKTFLFEGFLSFVPLSGEFLIVAAQPGRDKIKINRKNLRERLLNVTGERAKIEF